MQLPRNPILTGDTHHAYRDPAAIFADGICHLFFTLVETEPDGGVYMYLAKSSSRDLTVWSAPKKLTVRDQAKNFSSPGNIVRYNGRYVICFQTYCRENGEKYGNANSRLYIARSDDLETWSEPELLRVKGDIPDADMGRMIDPYLLFDESTGLWNCFYKQNGVSRSVSRDLSHWEYCGHTDGGENSCVVEKDGRFYLFHSPQNGIGVKVSDDLAHWQDVGEVLTLGQAGWDWARGRITAGFVLPAEGGWLMFFHGTGPEDESVIFDTHACIGVAHSRDLVHWEWR